MFCNDLNSYIMVYIMDFLYDTVPYVLTLGGIFAIGLLFSCAIVGHALRDDEINTTVMSQELVDEIENRLKHKKYEESFYDELEALENVELTKTDMDKLKNLYIVEDTPSGEIKMCYACDTETFWYYSKNKNISYPTLDAVARRYAVKHNCAPICINYRKEVEKVKNQDAQTQEADNSSTSSDKDSEPSVYVKLKSYNKVAATQKKKLVTVERSNRFTYKGVAVEEPTKKCETIEKITFAEYKKSLENNKKKTQ